MTRKKIWIVYSTLVFLLAVPQRLPAEPNLSGVQATGIASWYSESDPGINLHTANGETFDDSQRTCASWNFPFGTLLRVTHLENGKSVVCRVNDRGPAKRLGRVVDLTKSAFREVAPLKSGLIRVKVEEIGRVQSRLLKEHVTADSHEENLHENQKGLARDSFQDFLGRIRAQAHYATEA